MPYSPGATADDKTHSPQTLDDMFRGKEVVATLKQDGENTSIYGDGHVHARSIDSAAHPSRTWVRAMAGRIAHNFPDGFRVCGENLFAKHSIAYEDLPSYFLTFGIYEGATCLSWDDTVAYAEMLGLHLVPVIYRGIWDQKEITSRWETINASRPDQEEGYVVRLAGAFPHAEFKHSVAKWVRKNHVLTSSHWMHSKITPNKLKG